MKFYNKLKKYIKRVFTPVLLIGASSPTFATVDYSTLTTAVDFSSTTSAVIAVAAALVLVYIAWKGAKIILGAVKGG